MPGGPLDKPLSKISERTGASYDQILLAWAKAKGAVVVTNSSKKSRLLGYMEAGDLGGAENLRASPRTLTLFAVLADEEVAELDESGSKQAGEGFKLVSALLPAVGLFAVAFAVSRVLVLAGFW